MTTGRKAYQIAVTEQMKYQKRGYGSRVVAVNDCPDCLGRTHNCPTCGDEPDNPDRVEKHGKYWFRKIGA